MQPILVATGVTVILLLTIDVFYTVLHPQGHGGPLTRRVNRGIWRGWKRLARPGRSRDGWLALCGPVLTMVTPAIWASLLVGGFALIYYPSVENFLVSPGSLRVRWAEAVYLSGFSAATLGTGDIVPDSVSLRLLTVIEALAGFALLSASLSYILSIHAENAQKTTLAADIATHFACGAALDPWQDSQWLDDTARRLLHVMHAHAQYPILHYFHPADIRDALQPQLAPLVERLGATEAATEEPVLLALERYLRAAESRFLPGSGEQSPSVEQVHGRLLRYQAYEAD